MNFSQPGNAREVNKIKVLNALRGNNGLSRAQLSSLLGINKVSMGEIVDILVSEGLVAETGRQSTAKGRPGTSLSINLQHSTVIGIDIGSRVVTATLFKLPTQLEQHAVADTRLGTKENARLIREITEAIIRQEANNNPKNR